MIQSNCNACGTGMNSYPSERRRYCSVACMRRARSAPPTVAESQACVKCGEEKPANAFGRSSGRGGRPGLRLRTECKACRAAQNRAYYQRTAERLRASASLVWHARSAEEKLKFGRTTRARRLSAGLCIGCACRPHLPERKQCSECLRAGVESNSRCRRGLARSDAERLLFEHGGKCEISDEPIAFPGPGAGLVSRARPRAVVDHFDTADGPRARGVLSSVINAALGAFRHDPRMLLRAAMYLVRHHPEQRAGLAEALRAALLEIGDG
jgi:hypothetical protein